MNRYCLKQDNDGHWYIIKWEKRQMFDSLLNIDNEFFIDEFEADRLFTDVSMVSFENPGINLVDDDYE